MATTLLLARHGETHWNATGRWQGHEDVPLNDRGRAQARELADLLAEESVAAVYASDLQRARETAEIVGIRLGLPVETDPRLREISFGGWEGLTTPEIEERFPDEVARWRSDDGTNAFAGGETYTAMGKRVVAALDEIARTHSGETVLVVLHGGPIRALLAHAAGITYGEQRILRAHLANGEVVRVESKDGAFAPID